MVIALHHPVVHARYTLRVQPVQSRGEGRGVLEGVTAAFASAECQERCLDLPFSRLVPNDDQDEVNGVLIDQLEGDPPSSLTHVRDRAIHLLMACVELPGRLFTENVAVRGLRHRFGSVVYRGASLVPGNYILLSPATRCGQDNRRDQSDKNWKDR